MNELTPRVFIIALAAGLVPAGLAAQESTAAAEPRREYRVSPVTQKIKVDAVLDEAAWDDATMIPVPYEWFPGDNVAAPVETHCLVTFDDEHLYVGFRAFDPDPSKIRAYLADRDTPRTDDTVGILIDTFNDRRRAFEFRVNPLGVQMEATVSDVGGTQGRSVFTRSDLDGSQDWSWDAIWDSAARVTADGYVAEMAIPLKQLRFASTAEIQSWGFLATRHYPRSLDHELRSAPIDRGLNCQVCQFDTLTGFRQITPGRNLEIIPTLTATRSEPRIGDQPTTDDADAGLLVRWGVTPSVIFEATVNPDFSQVEADAAQLDVNERFALFFPEKRPFFLEGADLFETTFNVVFTRSIADPKAAVKLTGKEGKNTFAVLAAEDSVNSLIFPTATSSSFASLDQDVQSSILRYRRDVGATSAIGFLYAGREADGYHNRVLGVDGVLHVTDTDRFDFQIVGSSTDYPDELALAQNQPAGSFDDLSWRTTYTHATRDWFWRAFVSSRGKDFRADSGFMPQVDRLLYAGQIIRSFWGQPESWYSRLAVQLNAVSSEQQDGTPIEDSINLELVYEGPLQSEIQVGIRPNRETFAGQTFDLFRRDVFFSFRPRGGLNFEILLRGGEIIDFVNIRKAEFEKIRPRVGFRLGRHFEGSFDYNWEAYRVPGGQYLEANLAQSRLFYHFNSRAFLRAILQYRRVERNLDLYDVPVNFSADAKNGLSQLLFSYKLNAKTVFFLGYSDNYRGTEDVDFDQTNRALFMKIGYAWIR